jgi:major membrane immunogen (membrane-anchored lipoprotein)
MKKLLFGIALLSLVSCAKKKWDKDTIKAKFMKELHKNEDTKKLSEDVMTKISDCAAEKMAAQYKTEKDADKDESGVQAIMMQCTMDAMGMGGDKPAETTPTNTETPTTDHPEEKPAEDSTAHE